MRPPSLFGKKHGARSLGGCVRSIPLSVRHPLHHRLTNCAQVAQFKFGSESLMLACRTVPPIARNPGPPPSPVGVTPSCLGAS